MMPYFWLTLGVLAKVTGRTDGGNYRYETVVSKEIGLVPQNGLIPICCEVKNAVFDDG